MKPSQLLLNSLKNLHMHEHVAQCYPLDHLGPCAQFLIPEVLGAVVSFGYFQPETDFTRVQRVRVRVRVKVRVRVRVKGEGEGEG